MKRYILLVLFIGYSFIGFSQTSTDPDAEAFIAACNTDPSGVKLTDDQMTYITQMVEGLKSIGVWNKMVAVYPIVGGNAYKHKYNLKDPRDLDAAFRLSFLGGGYIHSINGVQPNGTSSHANTFIVPNTNLTLNSTHVSFYSNTPNASLGVVDIGTRNINNTSVIFIIATNNRLDIRVNDLSATQLNSANSTNGYVIANRNTPDIKEGYFLGVKSVLSANSISLPQNPILLNSLNSSVTGGVSPIGHSNRLMKFATIGQGLTDTEAIRLSHLIYYLQGVLQRQ